jgi:hypothetical protein
LHCNGRKSAFFILETQLPQVDPVGAAEGCDLLILPLKTTSKDRSLRQLLQGRGFDKGSSLRHSARPSNKTLFANPPIKIGGLILSGGRFSTAVFFEEMK